MPPEDRIRVLHMVEAARTARQFIAGRQCSDLDSDQMLLFALVRGAIEIIGEAASRISAETRAANPAVPWASIVAMRNRSDPRLFRHRPEHCLEDGDGGASAAAIPSWRPRVGGVGSGAGHRPIHFGRLRGQGVARPSAADSSTRVHRGTWVSLPMAWVEAWVACRTGASNL